MPSARLADYDNILARLRGLPAYMDQAIALMDEQLAAGLAQPDRGGGPDARPGVVAGRHAGAQLAAARGVFHVPRVDARQHAAAAARLGRRRLPAAVRARAGIASRPTCAIATSRGRGRRSGSARRRTAPAAYAQLVRFFTTTRMSAGRDPPAGAEGSGSHRARDARDRRRVRLHRHDAGVRARAGQPAGRQVRERGRDAGLRRGRAGEPAAGDAEAVPARSRARRCACGRFRPTAPPRRRPATRPARRTGRGPASST